MATSPKSPKSPKSPMDWVDDLVFEGPVEDIGGRAHAPALADELRKELGWGHVLHGKRWTIIAEVIPQDEVIVRTDDALWCVHLTWRGRRERAGYPTTYRFDSAADFWAYVDSFGWVRGEDY